MKTLLNIAAAIAVLGVAAPALAEPVTYTTQVTYGDLNLQSAKGAKALETRVARAATKVCGAPDTPSVKDIQEVATCRTIALEDARPAMELALDKARKGSVEILVAASR